MKCKICQAETTPIHQATFLDKYPVQYQGCPVCGFLQTDPPHWLAEAYSQPINRSDVGYITRNFGLADLTAVLLRAGLPAAGPYVDFGGGYGMFVRLMRDHGYDFYRQDKYCPNLFAPDFEAPDDPAKRYGLLTAFEVFEHLDDPIRDLESMLRMSDRILFSTEAIPLPYPPIDAWGYYGLEHGQHIALYAMKTLAFLARRYRLYLYSSPNRAVHLFSREPVSKLWWSLVFRPRVRWLIKRFARKPPSLLMPDYHQVVARIRAAPVE